MNTWQQIQPIWLHVGNPVKTEKNAALTTEYKKSATGPDTEGTMSVVQVKDEATNRSEAVFTQTVNCALAIVIS